MPATTDRETARQAEFARLAQSQFGPAYSLGIRHTASVLVEALRDYPLPATNQQAGDCFNCGDGNTNNVRVSTLADYVRNGYADNDILSVMEMLMSRIASAGDSWREFTRVTVRGTISTYNAQRDTYEDAPRETGVALCASCNAELADYIRTALDVSSRGAGTCAHCHRDRIMTNSIGRTIPATWMRNGIAVSSPGANYRYGDIQSATFNVSTIDTTTADGETLSYDHRPGQHVSTYNNDVLLCNDCLATGVSACGICAGIRPSAELRNSCRRCGYTRMCNECGAAHVDHFTPRDFRSSSDVQEAIEFHARRGQAGRTVRSTRTVGQEVETGARSGCMPNARILQEADRAIAETMGVGVISDIGTDCSITLSSAHEIRGLPVAGILAEHYADMMAHALNVGEWSHNLSTGAHVHIGVTSGEYWRAYLGHALTQRVVMAISDPERFNGGSNYARPIPDTDLIRMREIDANYGASLTDRASVENYADWRTWGQRYMTVNATSWHSHRTIEVRTPSGDIPHDATANLHLLAWLAGATDYFVTDDGYENVRSRTAADMANGGLADIVRAIEAAGNISTETAEFFCQALTNGRVIPEGDANETYCANCDCDCNDCPCEDQECGQCACGYDPCDHDGHRTYRNSYNGNLHCTNCDDVLEYA